MTADRLSLAEDATDLVTISKAVLAREGNASLALAMLSDDQFKQRLDMLKLAQRRIEIIHIDLMVKDEDYGIIPNTNKPTLLKPGAEKLCKVYELVPTFAIERLTGDGVTQPPLGFQVTCELHTGESTGFVVGQGVGAANAWETKYRHKGGGSGRLCPSCGKANTLKRSNYPDKKTGDKGWYCHSKVGGCSAQFSSTDKAITEQAILQTDNPDPYSDENTLLKMAAKRAQIDAVLRATATSGLFTQDVEDAPPVIEDTTEKATPPPQDALGPTTKPEVDATILPPAPPNHEALGIVRPPHSLTPLDLASLPAEVYLIAEVSDAFPPALARVRFLQAKGPDETLAVFNPAIKAKAEDCCRRMHAVTYTVATGEHGPYVKSLKREEQAL